MSKEQEHDENTPTCQDEDGKEKGKKTSQKITKTHNIFLIDKEKLDKLSKTSTEDALGLLMSEDEDYEVQTLKPDLNLGDFYVRLYFRGDDNYQSQFASFCKSFVADNQKAVTFYPRSASSVLFIWNSKHIYAVTTGQGYRMVEDYSTPKFGLIIASIFGKDFKVTSLDANAMASIVHSTKTIYTNEVDFIDVDALNTVFKEVTGRLKDKEAVHKLLGLQKTSKRDSVKVSGKNSVQFSSALSFSGLLHLLQKIEEYNFDDHKERFNLIAPISAKKQKAAIEANNAAVISEMYRAIGLGKDIPFDLFHKNTMSYVEADRYEIYDPATDTVYAAFDDYAADGVVQAAYGAYLGSNPDTLAAFQVFVKTAMIRSLKDDVLPPTDDSLLKHISGEIQVDGKNYYIFYGEYYYLDEAYTDRLNKSLEGKLRKEFDTDEIQTPWPNVAGNDEDWFNAQVANNEGYVHLHKIKPEGIEFADLIKCDGDAVTIVHVKDGFEAEMRALDRQVELSIARIMDLNHNNNDFYFRQLYQNAKKSSNAVTRRIAAAFPTADKFVESIKGKKLRYVIVVRPKVKKLINNESNIAKHCLNALILRCFQQGIELKIQIK